MIQLISQDPIALNNWANVNGSIIEQITITGYNEPYGVSTQFPKGILYGANMIQGNLRNRVSFTMFL